MLGRARMVLLSLLWAGAPSIDAHETPLTYDRVRLSVAATEEVAAAPVEGTKPGGAGPKLPTIEATGGTAAIWPGWPAVTTPIAA